MSGSQWQRPNGWLSKSDELHKPGATVLQHRISRRQRTTAAPLPPGTVQKTAMPTERLQVLSYLIDCNES
jgi:hypothetical protein